LLKSANYKVAYYVIFCILHRVAQAYLNQKRLDAEAKQLHHSATNFAKQTQQWVNLVESFSGALKEIGDAENWARSIEGDMRTITSALEYAYKGQLLAAELSSRTQIWNKSRVSVDTNYISYIFYIQTVSSYSL
jgi:hypothetical protein